MTRYMTKEFSARGLRANAIALGPIRTEPRSGLTPDFETVLAGQTALGCVGEAVDIGAMVASLLGPENAWTNGQTIEVSGGYAI